MPTCVKKDFETGLREIVEALSRRVTQMTESKSK
jgi:hypothetical protein